MKTMKYILLILCVSVATSVLAVDFKIYETSRLKTTSSNIHFYGESRGGNTWHTTTLTTKMPVVEFYSTSAMPSSGSSLSLATYDAVTIDEGGNAQLNSGPKRVGPNRPPADPFEDPLADAVPCLLLLAIGYAIYLGRKTSVPNPDSRK